MATNIPQQQADASLAQAKSQVPVDLLKDLLSPVEQLITSGAAEKVLKEGAQVPDFTLPDALGNAVTLSHLLMQGPVVISFYRGEWCPYCNLELRAYQRVLPQLQELGASLVAISPQTPDHSLSMVEKQKLAFAVLSDVGNQVAREYGLVFTIDEAVRTAHRRLVQTCPRSTAMTRGNFRWQGPFWSTSRGLFASPLSIPTSHAALTRRSSSHSSKNSRASSATEGCMVKSSMGGDVSPLDGTLEEGGFLINTIRLTFWIVRVVGAVTALLGWLSLIATSTSFIFTHMVLGIIFALLLLALSLILLLTGRMRLLGASGIVYTLMLTALGFTQTGLLEGPMHWLIQAAHVVIGFGGLALVQVISVRDARLRKRAATVPVPRATVPRAVR
jgi:peroxiredoxin